MTDLIQEAIEAAATQDLCGNHNSADLLRRLARELEAERAEVEQMYRTLYAARDCISSASDQLTKKHAKGLDGKKWGWWYLDLANAAIAAHAKRREAGE